MNPGGKQKGYGPFVLAAAIYTAGVVAFSGWAYFRQRANLHAQIDQSLVNATYAIEQVLGGIFLECAVETETTREMGCTVNRTKLDTFADDCRFTALGAIGHKDAKIWALTAGGAQNGLISEGGDTPIQSPLPSELSAIVLELAKVGGKAIQMKTVQIESYGTQRIAVRYHASSPCAGYALVAAIDTCGINQLQHALALRTLLIGIFLYAMAIPLVALYNRTQVKTAREMARLNARLQQDFALQKIREAELEDAIRDLERFNAIALGREDRILGLKAEVNTLLKQMQRKKRYNTVLAHPPRNPHPPHG